MRLLTCGSCRPEKMSSRNQLTVRIRRSRIIDHCVQVDGARDEVEGLRLGWQDRHAEVTELRSRWKLALGQMQVSAAFPTQGCSGEAIHRVLHDAMLPEHLCL